jgi:hypothetical protein
MRHGSVAYGHLRVLALKELGMRVDPCLFARDDESFSYNFHVNRLSTIAEHYMIRRAIDRGVSKERLARAFNVNLRTRVALAAQEGGNQSVHGGSVAQLRGARSLIRLHVHKPVAHLAAQPQKLRALAL